MTVPAIRRITRLTNELIVFVPEKNWTPELVQAIRVGGTKQIVVNQVRDFRTPFGTHMIIATLTVTRVRAQTWDLRDYLCNLLVRSGLNIEISDVLAPSRAEIYRVI